MSDITVNSAVPAFSLATDTVKTISNDSLMGQAYVIYFYPKDDTPGCTKEAIAFTEHAQAFEEIGVKIIGVSKDSITKHTKFREKHSLGIILGADETGAVCEAFGVWKEKSMYGRTYMGIERSTFLVDAQGAVRHIWPKVKVKGHAEAVLSTAQELLVT